jgi:hypothetical protein
MKGIRLGLLSCALVLAFASCNRAVDDDGETRFQSFYQGKRYTSMIPSKVLNASLDFDPANPTLPKSIKDIIEVAFTQLERVTGSKTGWNVHAIDLKQSWRNEKKWYYAVFFVTSSGTATFTTTVTVNGRLGIVKEIQERTID